MNNAILQIKIKQRINKLDSQDYDNIRCWQIVETFNKAQSQWCRRQLHGGNQYKEGDEQSKRRIDDLQILLKDSPNLVLSNKVLYEEAPIPVDYMEWKRISAYAIDSCCDKPRKMKIFQVEEANIDEILADYNKRPSFAWAETVATLKNNNVLIYTNDEFTIDSSFLVYYRQPTQIQIAGCMNPYSGIVSAVDVECEFKDDITELLIGECAEVIAGDIEALIQQGRQSRDQEKNN